MPYPTILCAVAFWDVGIACSCSSSAKKTDSLPLGGKVSPKVTDEGITFPIDVGLGEAVCLPRIEEEPFTLC